MTTPASGLGGWDDLGHRPQLGSVVLATTFRHLRPVCSGGDLAPDPSEVLEPFGKGPCDSLAGVTSAVPGPLAGTSSAVPAYGRAGQYPVPSGTGSPSIR